MLRLPPAFSACAIGAGAARAESPSLGKPISQTDFAEWDINILPDGTNLPPGNGKAADGAKIFADKCALCHGDKGQGGIAVRLIGGPAEGEPQRRQDDRQLLALRDHAVRLHPAGDALHCSRVR